MLPARDKHVDIGIQPRDTYLQIGPDGSLMEFAVVQKQQCVMAGDKMCQNSRQLATNCIPAATH